MHLRSIEELAAAPALQSRSGLFRGLIAQGLNINNTSSASAFARQRWGSTTKAAVAAITTPGTVGDEAGAAATEFFAAVTQTAIVGQLSNLRRVPLLVRTLTATGAAAHWTGEGQMKPLSPIVYVADALSPLKVVALTVVTMETLRDTTPSAEALIRADLSRAVAEKLDTAFIDPANAGIPDVMPASVTNGITPIAATASPAADLTDLFNDFEGDLRPQLPRDEPRRRRLARRPDLSQHRRSWRHPGRHPRDHVSRSVPHGTIVLLDPTGIALGEGPAIGRVSTVGDVLMADAGTMASTGIGSPSGPVPATLVSLVANKSRRAAG